VPRAARDTGATRGVGTGVIAERLAGLPLGLLGIEVDVDDVGDVPGPGEHHLQVAPFQLFSNMALRSAGSFSVRGSSFIAGP
jgi:hypothetical protein